MNSKLEQSYFECLLCSGILHQLFYLTDKVTDSREGFREKVAYDQPFQKLTQIVAPNYYGF